MSRVRLAAAAVVFAGSAVVPLAATVPAQASVGACVNYLGGKGYSLSAYVEKGCEYGASGDFTRCERQLLDVRVKPEDARIACQRA